MSCPVLLNVLFAPKDVLASQRDSSKADEPNAVMSSDESCKYASTFVFNGSSPRLSTDEFICNITLIPVRGDVGEKVGAAVGSVGAGVGKAVVGEAVGLRVGSGVAAVGAREGAPFSPGARVGAVVGLGVGSRLTLLQLDIQKKWESSQGVPVESGWSAQLPVSYKGSLFPMYQRQHADGKLVPTYVLHKS